MKLRLLAALAVIAVACGGKSIRHDGAEDGTGGDGAEPGDGGTTPGGTSPGGTSPGGTSFGGTSFGGTSFGGTTGAAPNGGGGTSGVAGVPTGGFGGTFPTGGTGVGAAGTGTGGVAGICRGDFPPGVPSPGLPVYWDEGGRIDWSSSAFGIQGSWYSFDDCQTAQMHNLPCTKRDPALIAYNGERGWTTAPYEACARGVAAQVVITPDGTPAWSLQWGFGMGFSLNDGLPYDADFMCVDGLSFDIKGSYPAEIRVNLTTTTTEENPYFATARVQSGGTLAYSFAHFAQGPWVTNPEPLDIRRLTNLQFFVYTSDLAPTPFDFCIANVRFSYHVIAR